MTYQEIYKWGCAQLAEAGIEEASLDARLLLEEICGTDRNYMLVHGEEEITSKQEVNYREWISGRKSHIPLQHITGYQEFMGLRFKVTPDVLIPRQDTEILVEEVMRYLHDGMRILDLCTGSGCILLSLLKYSNDCVGVGSDISEKALAVARENAQVIAEKNVQVDAKENASFIAEENIQSRSKKVTFVQSDLFEKIEGKYEIIVSNPPYIPTGVIPTLMEEVKDHEPIEALDGKEDGLYFYKRMIDEAGNYLYPGGMLFFEIGCEQAADVSDYMIKAGYCEVTVCKDFAGLDRVVYGTCRG